MTKYKKNPVYAHYLHNVLSCSIDRIIGVDERLLELSVCKHMKRHGFFCEEPESEDNDGGQTARASRIRVSEDVRRELAAYAAFPADVDFLENVPYLAEEFGLDDLDAAIVRLLVAYDRVPEIEGVADSVLQHVRSASRAVALLVAHRNARTVHERFLPGNALIDSGLLVFDAAHSHSNSLSGDSSAWLRLTLRDQMVRPHADRRRWLEAVTGPSLEPRHPITDFDHVAGAQFAFRLLRGALERKATGIVIALYGPPGTGKSELARVLAHEAGASLFAAGEAAVDRGEPDRTARMGRILLMERILARRPGSILLVDEADDVFVLASASQRAGRGNGSKVFMNRLLEQCQIPIILCCNDPNYFDPALRRRISAAIELPLPGPVVRERIWRRVLVAEGLNPDAAPRLASELPASAGVAAIAARAARLADDETRVHAIATGVLKFMGTRIDPPDGQERFHPDLVEAGTDIEALIRSLDRQGGSRAFSICAHGPPGTGKSALVRHIAERLGYRVLQKRASDLLSKWVGGSEENIAQVFATARATEAFLIFDEADSLLADRRDARQSWEVSQVNEMLTWTESHPLPFACTTNLIDRLDAASLRRFTFKFEVRPLDAERAVIAFRRFFGVEPPADRLWEGLTPGDFTVVARKAAVLGGQPADLVRWLEEEHQARAAYGQKIPIGFMPTGSK